MTLSNNELKNRFLTGKIPTQNDFHALIDAKVSNTVGEGLTVELGNTGHDGQVTNLAQLQGKIIKLTGLGSLAQPRTGLAASFAGNNGVACALIMGRYGYTWGTYIGFHTHSDNANVYDELTERARLDEKGLTVNGGVLSRVINLSGNPTAADLPNGCTAVFKNTATGTVALWANNGGIFINTILN